MLMFFLGKGSNTWEVKKYDISQLADRLLDRQAGKQADRQEKENV